MTKAEQPGALERYAVSFLQERLKDDKASAYDPAYILSDAERAGIDRVVTGTMWRGAIVGSMCSALAVAVESFTGNDELWSFGTLILVLVTILTALIEMLYLYWKHLDAVTELARITGLQNLGLGKYPETSIAEAIARSALELPDPLRAVDGINPLRESPKWILVLGALAYKLKYTASNFFLKFLLRRVATRGILRAAVPYVAVPLSAFWNSYTSYRILRESRMRAVGPSAVQELHRNFLAKYPNVSEGGLRAIFRAVAVAMVRKREAHPNLVILYRSLEERYGKQSIEELDSTEHFLSELKPLERKEKDLALTVLQVAIILDGSISTREEEFLLAARTACGFTGSLKPVHYLLRAFTNGKPITSKALEAL
jgi:hypothetical protein